MATTKKTPKKDEPSPAEGRDMMAQQGADMAGARLLQALKDELLAIKNPGNRKQNLWETLTEIQQDEILDRFGRRITHELQRAYQAILSGGLPAVHANLAKVAFSNRGIQGQLEIPAGSEHRHALADFSGQGVLVVLAEDLEEYLDSMRLVKPDSDQRELDLSETAAIDNPELDGLTPEALRERAVAAAVTIDETDIDAGVISTWGEAQLIDYIEWAEGRAALPGDHPAGDDQDEVTKH